MSRLRFVVSVLALVLVPALSALAEDGTAVLERLSGLISVVDLPTGFREVNRYASPSYTDAFIRYEGADGEIVMAMARVTSAEDEQEWLREATQALRAPRHGLRFLGLGDGAFAHRTSNISKAYVLVGAWRLTVGVEKGTRSGAEANRLAEQLLRKMFARFTGREPPRPDVPEIRPVVESSPPVIHDLWYSPRDPTYDDTLRLTVRFSDPENRPVVLHWWYPQGVTLQVKKVSVPAGTHTHTFELPGTPDRENLKIEVFVEDETGNKVHVTKEIRVEAPFARVTASSGQMVVQRRISRLRGKELSNLYAGDIVHFGSDHDGGLGRTTADLDWPSLGVQGRYIFDPIRHGGSTSWSSITIGPAGLPEFGATGGQFLFSQRMGNLVQAGAKFIFRGDPLRVGGAIGVFENVGGTAGGSGIVYVKLKSLVVVEPRSDGGLDFYTYEGQPELITSTGRKILVPAAHRTRIRSGTQIDPPVRFDPSSPPDMPSAEGVQRAGVDVVEIKRVELVRDVVRADGRGILAKAHLRIKGRRGVPTQVYAFFADRNETPLKDANQRYFNTAGQVCSYVTVEPAHDDTTWNPPLELFLPYSELHLPVGTHELKVHLEVFDPQAQRDLHETPKQSIRITSDNTLGEARLANIRLNHNQTLAGQKGMGVLFELNAKGRLQRKTTVTVVVQSRDGRPLRDLDRTYVDDQGNVATRLDFMPAYEDAHWAAPRMFIPYAQLHLAQGRHDLRLALRVLDPSTGTHLAASSWLDFQITQN